MKKRIALILTVVMVCATLLAGCGSSKDKTEGSKEDSGKGTLKMWTFIDPSNKENGRSVALKKMIDTFEDENPGTKVVVEPQDWNTMTAKFLAAYSSNNAPDIIWCARDELSGVLDAKALEPLENLFLKDWSKDDIADIDDAYYKFAERDGKHYALTVNKNAIGILYREDLLKNAGLEVPTTWDKLLECAKSLTGKDEATGMDRYGLGQSFATESNDPQLLSNYLLEKNGTLFDKDGKADWANEVGEEGLNWVTQCIDLGVTPKECVNTSIEDMYTEFSTGKYAMCVGSGVRLESTRQTATFDGSTIQFAQSPGQPIIDGWFVGVSSKSENKEMAGKFLEKIYTPESDKEWIEVGGQAPLRKSTTESLKITDKNKYMEVMSKCFEEGWLPSNDMPYIGWKYDLNLPVQDVLTKNAKPMDALRSAEEKFDKANKR